MNWEKQWKKGFMDFCILSFIIQLLDLKKAIFFLKKKDLILVYDDSIYSEHTEPFMKYLGTFLWRLKKTVHQSNTPKFLQSPFFFFPRSLVKFPFHIKKQSSS